MLCRLIKPFNAIRVASNISSRRLMATASNYHYHEKPPIHAHDRLWKAERYLSLGLLGVLPAAAMVPMPIMDYAVALSLVIHVHWGVEAIVTDYVRPSIFGPTIPKISIALVYILSSLTLGGLFMFNYTDVGITQATRMLAKLWKLTHHGNLNSIKYAKSMYHNIWWSRIEEASFAQGFLKLCSFKHVYNH